MNHINKILMTLWHLQQSKAIEADKIGKEEIPNKVLYLNKSLRDLRHQKRDLKKISLKGNLICKNQKNQRNLHMLSVEPYQRNLPRGSRSNQRGLPKRINRKVHQMFKIVDQVRVQGLALEAIVDLALAQDLEATVDLAPGPDLARVQNLLAQDHHRALAIQ